MHTMTGVRLFILASTATINVYYYKYCKTKWISLVGQNMAWNDSTEQQGNFHVDDSLDEVNS